MRNRKYHDETAHELCLEGRHFERILHNKINISNSLAEGYHMELVFLIVSVMQYSHGRVQQTEISSSNYLPICRMKWPLQPTEILNYLVHASTNHKGIH